LLKSARNGGSRLYLHAIHLGEVYYITFRAHGDKNADLAYARIKAFPLKLIDSIDEPLLLTAALFKAQFPISYADSFAAALSNRLECTLLTGDSEFKSLEKAGRLTVEWLK